MTGHYQYFSLKEIHIILIFLFLMLSLTWTKTKKIWTHKQIKKLIIFPFNFRICVCKHLWLRIISKYLFKFYVKNFGRKGCILTFECNKSMIMRLIILYSFIKTCFFYFGRQWEENYMKLNINKIQMCLDSYINVIFKIQLLLL